MGDELHQSGRASRWHLPVLLLWPAVVAIGLQLHATARLGPGLSPDSAVYLQGARRLASGLGYTQLRPTTNGPQAVAITWYPPAYSALLAGGMRVGFDVIAFARLISAAMLGACVMMGVGMVWWVTRSTIATLLGGIVIGLAPEQLEVFAYALSEPPFIAALLVTLGCLARYLSRLGVGWLATAALAVSLAAMTRYIGLLAVPFGIMAILILSTRRPVKRFRDAVIFAVLASLGNIFLTVHNRTAAGSGTGRKIEWHPIVWAHVRAMFQTFTEWLAPSSLWRGAGQYVWWIAPTIAAVALVIAILEIRRRGVPGIIDRLRCRPGGYLVLLMLAFSLTYVMGMFLSMSFIDAATPMDFRTLSPLFIPLTVPAIGFCSIKWKRAEGARARFGIRGAVLLLVAAVLVNNVWRSVRWSIRNHETGERLTYASKRWHDSQTIEAMRQLPRAMPVWTNASDAVYLQTERVDRLLPGKYTADGKREIAGFAPAIDEVGRSIAEGRGVAVYFFGVQRRPQPLPTDLDAAFSGLGRLEVSKDAIVYGETRMLERLRGNPKEPPEKQ